MNRRRLPIALAILAAIGLALWVRTAWDTQPPAPAPADPTPTAGTATPHRSAAPPLAPAGPAAAPSQLPAPDAQLAELADKLERDPNTHVVCDLDIDVDHAVAYLAIGGHSDMNGRRVEVVHGRAYLPLVYDLGDQADVEFEERTGLFSLEGYGPTSVAWTDRPEDGGHGSCTAAIAPEAGSASLTGSLTLDPSGEPAAGAWVEGCGNMAFADQHGVVHMDIVTEPCTLLAMRRDGMLRTMSEPVDVVPEAGRDVVVDFVIPEAKRAGLGIRVRGTETGVLIEGLVEGGPATDAGLLEGDRVVAVDGTSTLDGDLQDFVEAVGGEQGTDVVLTVDRGGQQVEVTVTRQVLGG